jgi:hypothetical protein
MIELAAIDPLRRLAEEAVDAAGGSREPAGDYARLRGQAQELNSRYSLMPDGDFDNLLPSPDALFEIDSLHRALGETFDEAPSRGTEATLDRQRALLLSLAGWAAGFDAAYHTLH